MSAAASRLWGMGGRVDIILDVDTGIDDSLAIAYTLGAPEGRLIGVVSTYGNVTEAVGARNSLAVLDLLGARDVPVYHGLTHPQERSSFTVSSSAAFIHGENGVGNADLPASSREVKADGLAFIEREIRAHAAAGVPLVYVPTGTFTNLAAVLRRHPDLAGMIRVVAMGGAYAVPGNVSPWAEANISQDPEAAAEVFASGADLTLVGLDVTHQTVLTAQQAERWRAAGTAAGRFFADMVLHYIGAYAVNSPKLGGCGLHDPLAAAVALTPALVGTEVVALTAETEGEQRGRTRAVAPGEGLGGVVNVARTVRVDQFIDMFMERTLRVISRG